MSSLAKFLGHVTRLLLIHQLLDWSNELSGKWAQHVRRSDAILANLSPDSRNLANFESVWLQIFWILRFGEFPTIFLKHLAPNFWFGEMYDPYICTYLLTYSYVDLLFLRLLMVWKFMTSNESMKVFKVEAWYWTLLIKYVYKMLKLTI